MRFDISQAILWCCIFGWESVLDWSDILQCCGRYDLIKFLFGSLSTQKLLDWWRNPMDMQLERLRNCKDDECHRPALI